jgi:aspartyl/asparaginyl beta-hydroxylase (cupin superfamily)
VANEERTWTEGRCLLFDHSFRHEAWNRSDRRRVTLIADVWNPELSSLEVQAVHRVFRWLYEQTHGDD